MFIQYANYILDILFISPLLIIGLLVLILLLLIPKINHSELKNIYKISHIELFIIVSIWVFFFIFMMIYKRTLIDRKLWGLLFLSLILAEFKLALNILKKASKKSFLLILTYAKENIEILVVNALILFIVLLHINTPPMYDANLYYGQFIKGLNGFYYGLKSFVDSFTIWGKQFQPITPFLLFGEIISPGTARGVYFVNVLLLMGAVICVYEILLEDFKNILKFQAAALSMIFACFPFVISNTIYITSDFYCAVLFVYTIFFYKKNWIWLFSYMSTSLICAKSNMVVTYIIFLLLMELKDSLSWKDVKQILIERPLFLYILPLEIMYFFRLFGNNSAGSMSQGENTLFQKSVNRFFQMYIFGYKWLIILLFIITLIITIRKYGINRIKFIPRKYVFELSIIISSFSQWILFEIMSKKLTLCSRYFAQNALMYTILLAFAINNNFVREKIKNILCFSMAALFIVQLHNTTDPSMILFSDSIEFCNGKVYLSVTKYKDELIGIGDNLAYNFDFALWDNIFTDMLSDNEWNEEIIFYSLLDEEHMLGCEDYRYGVTFTENYNVYWNSERNKITYIDEGYICYPFSIISIMENTLNEWRSELRQKEVIYLIKPDNMNDIIKEKICNWGFKEVETKEYYNNITKLSLIKLEKR